MSSYLKTLAVIAVLAPGLAFGATKKKAAATTDSPQDQTLMSSGSMNSTLPSALHNHLSIYAAYDLSDTLKAEKSYDTDHTFMVGAEYLFNQISPGIAFQGGGTYDFSRDVHNAGGLNYQIWTAYGEATAKVTKEFKLMGGLNYNFPTMSGAADGASIKGKVGYQFGGSYQFASNFSIDGRYRVINFDTTGANGASTSSSSSGLVVGGRYTF